MSSNPINNQNRLPVVVALGITLAAGGFAATFYTAVSAGAVPPKKKAIAKPKPVTAVAPSTTQTGFTDNTPLTEEQRVVHVLNRLGFGARPGDVEKVKAIGLPAYINAQLNPTPQLIASADEKLAPFEILDDTPGELVASYFYTISDGAKMKQLAGGIMDRMAKDGNGAEAMTPEAMAEMTPAERQKRTRQLMASATPEEREKLKEMAKKRQKEGRRDGIMDASRALQVAKVVRATESEAQLYEVMADFWSNHFNIDIRKNQCRMLKVADEREVARKHALGKFRDILGASAHSPAMLVYLDNANNVMPEPENPRREKMRQAYMDRMAAQNKDNPLMTAIIATKRGKAGLNENYAREIMELHTLGVDGGYTQKDVQEVARCFTGWGVGGQRSSNPGAFLFTPAKHDNGAKTVLGVTIPAGGGESDGEKVMDILANHPATMRHVSTKLCQRLVSDVPPASLVDKCVATWKRTNGDTREIVRTIVTSPEFYSRAAYRQKIKSPFEYAVSSVRAVGGTFDLTGAIQQARLYGGTGGISNATALNRTLPGQVATMGQPLYQYQAPTGYPEDGRKWVSTGALVSRLNFALGLMRGDLVEVRIPKSEIPVATTDAGGIVNAVTGDILRGDVSPSTRATLLKQANMAVTADSDVAGQNLEARLTALVLGSPEFQRR